MHTTHAVHSPNRRLLCFALAAGLVLSAFPVGADEQVEPTAPTSSDMTSQSVRIDVLLTWGKFALESGRFAEAEARFREVLDLDWNNPRAFGLLQESREQRGKTLKSWIRSGRAAEKEDDPALAERHYRRVLDEDPDNRTALNGVARLRRQREVDRYVRAGLEKYIQEDYPGAEMDFRQALAIDPGSAMATWYQGQVQQQMTESSGLADLRSDDPTWTKYLEALKKLRAGDLGGAEQLWREILEAYPGNEAVLSNLEQVARRRKQEYSSQDMAP